MGSIPPPPYDPRFQQEQWRAQQRIAKEQARASRQAWKMQMRAQRDQMKWEIRSRYGRRSSIIGPLVVIVVGVIFFLIQTGRLQSESFWGWYGHWWPLLLVGVGVVMVAEWAFDRWAHPDEPIRRSNGGAVLALIALLITGLVFTGIHHPANLLGRSLHINGEDWDQFVGDKHESDMTPIAQSFPAGGTLSIDNPHGDVTISGTSDDGMIHVTAHKEVYTDSDSTATQRSEQLNPHVSVDGNNVTVSVPSARGGKVDVNLVLPASATVNATTNHGELHLANVKGMVTLTSNHGDVEASAVTGNLAVHINNNDSSLTARSISGLVLIEGRMDEINLTDITGMAKVNGDFFGSAHFERIQGGVQIHNGRTTFEVARLDGQADVDPHHDITVEQAVGPLVLNTRNHDIDISRVSGDVTLNNKNGSVDVKLAQPMGHLTVANNNGAVNVTVPDNASFSVQAETKNGNADTDFSLKKTSSNDMSWLNGSVGGGSKMLRVVTTEGDISIRHNSLAPMPPTPPAPPKISDHPIVDIDDGNGNKVKIGKDGTSVIDDGEGNRIVKDKNGIQVHSAPSKKKQKDKDDEE